MVPIHSVTLPINRLCCVAVCLLTVVVAPDPASSDVSNGGDNSRAGMREREQQRQAHAHGTRTTSGSQRKQLMSTVAICTVDTITVSKKTSTCFLDFLNGFLDLHNSLPLTFRQTLSAALEPNIVLISVAQNTFRKYFKYKIQNTF